MTEFTTWSPTDAAGCIRVPEDSDDKYSRGVLGVLTGSDQYPGAAVLGVDAALRTGVGMVRYLGPERATTLVLARRPEAVISDGRVQAWLIGSGMDHAERDETTRQLITKAVSDSVPLILDGGALDLHESATGPTIITPHAGELARVMDWPRERITAEPGQAAVRAASQLGVTVLLKGSVTLVASPGGTRLSARVAPPWLATAGAGDALGGILGALLATHASEIADDENTLARLGAAAAVIHGLAAESASGGGPFTILDLVAAIPATIAKLLS